MKSSLNEVGVQAFIYMLNGTNLNINILPSLPDFCANLTPNVNDMSDEIDDYIQEIAGNEDGCTNQEHPLILEYREEIRNILDDDTSEEIFSIYCNVPLDINNKTGQQIKDIINEKLET
jgi:hypothetical protein